MAEIVIRIPEIRIPIEIPEMEQLMASVQELQTNVDNLTGKLELMRNRVAEDVQALRDQIAQADLDQAVLDEVNSRVNSIAATVEAIDPDPNNPAPAPEDIPSEPQQ